MSGIMNLLEWPWTFWTRRLMSNDLLSKHKTKLYSKMVWVLHRKRDQQNSTDLYENFIFDKVEFQIIRKRTNYSINEWEQLTSHFEKNRWISISHLCRVSLVCSKDNFCILLHPGMCPRGEFIWTLPVGSTVLRSRARPMGRTDREAQEGSGAKVPVGSISG